MGGGRLGVASKTGMWSILCSMKQQISNRLGVAHVRDTMMQFITGAITRQQAMESLQVGQSQLYSLRTSYLAARAQGHGDDWEPGSSGGNHMPTWPDKVQSFLRRALEPDGDDCLYLDGLEWTPAAPGPIVWAVTFDKTDCQPESTSYLV